MCCSSSDAVNVLNTDTRKLKDGKLKRFKTGMFGNKWKECFAVLYSDSTFLWYDEKENIKPIGSILLKDVLPYMCMGLMTDRMPVRRPNLPANCSVHHLVGIGMDPRAEKVYWFLFDSDSDLEGWLNEIMKTLPKPPTLENPQKDDSTAYKSTAPPPYDGGQPTHTYQSHPAGAQPHFNSYPQQYNGGYGGMQPGGQTTVIVGQQPDNTGAMLATGMIGGALLGYGLGSCFAPGFGMHGGFGGGYVSNETTVNNYYGGEPPANAENPGDTAAGDASGGFEDVGAGDYGGADFGDIGGGGDFGGGFDFGGGDFGGGDF